MKGALAHFITGSVKGIGGWIMENFRSALTSAKEFAGELWGKVVGRVGKSMLQDLMERASWSPTGGLDTAYRIMMAESGGNPKIVGPRWNGDKGSVGLFQIQTGAHPQFDFDKLMDPLYNVQAAKYVYQRQGWPAWSTYDRGGVWPSGSIGVNRSGSNEAVLNSETFGRLLSLLEGRRGVGSTINVAVAQPSATADEIADEIAWKLRFAT
jgi:hypothetical protein